MVVVTVAGWHGGSDSGWVGVTVAWWQVVVTVVGWQVGVTVTVRAVVRVAVRAVVRVAGGKVVGW
jgi:hypothetical protein